MQIKDQTEKHNRLQLKVCGLTCVTDAVDCALLGVDAVGFVFYPKSPRQVSPELSRKIIQELPKTTCPVGVFVDESYESIMKTVEKTQLRAVQLHGFESPNLVENLRKEHLVVIKGLFMSREPFLNTAFHYPASAFLVESGAGKLPGGNAETWEYALAAEFRKSHPLILAGGLTEKNIQAVVRACLPDAVDLSSGVEIRPGKKDLIKVKMFLDKLSEIKYNQSVRRIFL